MKEYLIEIATTDYTTTRAAVMGGADRILKAMPLVVHAPLTLPVASSAIMPMVSWLFCWPGSAFCFCSD